MRSALGLGHGMDFIHDHPADGRQDLARRAGQQQEERFRGGNQNVRRVPFDLPALARRRIAGSNRHGDRRLRQAQPLSLEGDATQRRLQVAFDVDGERLEGRDIQDATALRLWRYRLVRQLVDAPEEGRERLATAGGRRHQRVLAGGDRAPAALLDLGRSREGARKPRSGRRRKEVQNSGHRLQFIALRRPLKT